MAYYLENDDRTLLEKLRSGIQPPKSIAQDATELEALYRSHMAPGGGLSTFSAMRGRSES